MENHACWPVKTTLSKQYFHTNLQSALAKTCDRTAVLSVNTTDLILDWIKLLYYRKPAQNYIPPCGKKQYGVILRNESTTTRRVYRKFEAFPSAELNRCFEYKRTKYFPFFGGTFF